MHDGPTDVDSSSSALVLATLSESELHGYALARGHARPMAAAAASTR